MACCANDPCDEPPDDDAISRWDSGGRPLPIKQQMQERLDREIEDVDMRYALEKATEDGARLSSPKRSPRAVKAAMSSVKGARSGNEDFHGMRITNDYAFSFVCDGHGGSQVSELLGAEFQKSLVSRVKDLAPSAKVLEMVEVLRAAYRQAVEAVDQFSHAHAESEGSTLSALLLQLGSMVCATLQLGDCEVLVAHAETGELVEAEVMHYCDEGDEDQPDMMQHTAPVCATRPHDFGDPAEVARFNRALTRHGMSLRAEPRTDAMRGEERYWGKVSGSSVEFNECARAVETLNMYPPDFRRDNLHLLQRTPEFVVWQLPTTSPLALIVCCDGFKSKKAFPDSAHTAKCICNPEAYMSAGGGEQCLEGTIVKRFANKQKFFPPGHAAWSKDSVECLYSVLHTMAPDATWKQAISDSWKYIGELRAAFGKVPSLLQNPQAATAMSTNLAVLLMSDDNVSLNVLTVQ